MRRLSRVLSKITTKRSTTSRPSSLIETEPPRIVPMVARFEDIEESPAPSFVEVEEVTSTPGVKSVRRFCRMEQVDLSLFRGLDGAEQHATDKMIKAQQVLLTSEESSASIDYPEESHSEEPLTLARADRSWLKSTLSL